MRFIYKLVFCTCCVLVLLLYKEHLSKLLLIKTDSTIGANRLSNKMDKKYIGGYYWSGALKETKPEDLNPNLLTHLYYAFINVNEDGSLTIQNEEKGYVPRLAKLKSINPDLKVLFSVVDAKGTFSKVCLNEKLRALFIENAHELVKKYNYDGLDFDWEFPKDVDKENFVKLLSEIYPVFNKSNYQITAAVRSIPIYDDTGYIVPEMVKYLDIINIMTYDFYGSWSKTTGQNSPLFPCASDNEYEKKYLNIEASIKNWIEAGAPKEKLAMGLPFYGRTFTLKDPSEHGLHAPSLGGGKPLAPTYYQILANYQNYKTEWNAEQMSPYKYSDSTWLAYEDERSISIKTNYAKTNKLYGVFVWQLGGDDIHGEFSKKKQTLLQTIADTLTEE